MGQWAPGYLRKLALGCSLFFLSYSSLAAGPSYSQLASQASTQNPSQAYELLKTKSHALSSSKKTDGWAYIVSGGIGLAVSIPAYYLSSDIFAKAVYSIGQTISVGSIGYGAFLVLIDDDYTRFFSMMERVPQLSQDEKNRLAYIFLSESSERARRVRRIRVISHSLTAGLNFLSGATSDNKDLKTALYFVGGINIFAALNFGFRPSEEETAFKRITWKAEPILGPRFVGVQLRF